MKFKTTKECKSNNIFKRSQEINNRESEKGCFKFHVFITSFCLKVYNE
ncbi:hypothetical protein V322_02707, partial [Staphylococcus aureus F19466]